MTLETIRELDVQVRIVRFAMADLTGLNRLMCAWVAVNTRQSTVFGFEVLQIGRLGIVTGRTELRWQLVAIGHLHRFVRLMAGQTIFISHIF